jgi:hypothetical protein
VIFTWNHVLSAPDGLLHVTLLDGEGTVLVQTPNGGSVLIGGGPSPAALNQALGQMLPAGHRQVDAVIVGSTAKEDLLGLTGAIKNIPVQLALWGIGPEVNQTCMTVYATLKEKGTPIHTLQVGQALALEEDLHIDVLWAGDRGAVLWLTWGNFSALIPTGKVEAHWMDVPLPPDVVFLPDGIPPEDLPLEVINRWAPAVIALPLASTDLPLLGEHPTLEFLQAYPVVSNIEHGWVRVSTDGKQAWVHAEK